MLIVSFRAKSNNTSYIFIFFNKKVDDEDHVIEQKLKSISPTGNLAVIRSYITHKRYHHKKLLNLNCYHLLNLKHSYIIQIANSQTSDPYYVIKTQSHTFPKYILSLIIFSSALRKAIHTCTS